MELGLTGKTVIVTGGAANIGRGITFSFIKEGCNVVIADIDEEQGQKVVKEVEGMGGKAIAVKTDVTDYASVEAMAKKTIETFGQIDVLVNNAGFVSSSVFIKKPIEDWDKEIKINLYGVLNCTKVVLDHMVERQDGKIINIASDGCRVGEPREPVYQGTKGAVISLGKTIAREVGRYNITVNAICPGANIPTEPGTAGKDSMWANDLTTAAIPEEIMKKMIGHYPLGRLGNPEDVAKATIFFASDMASYITGQTLSVSGGFTMV